MNKILMMVGIVVGILFVLLSVVYFVNPANNLPHFIPGYDANLTRHHITHGVGTLFLGLLSFAGAWFMSGKKQLSKEQTQDNSNSNTVDGEGQ